MSPVDMGVPEIGEKTRFVGSCRELCITQEEYFKLDSEIQYKMNRSEVQS
jgi:hypothetical protein